MTPGRCDKLSQARPQPIGQQGGTSQVPIAQRVKGLQLEPRSSLSMGLHWTF